MRLFQNSGIAHSYTRRLRELTCGQSRFDDLRRTFLDDRFGASHFLKPVLDGSPEAFFTNGDDVVLQKAWAAENGMRSSSKLADILLAQIEAHRTEVFYNLDPVRYPSSFVARLPGCVTKKIAWRAAPSGAADMGAYDWLLSNFPSFTVMYEKRGWRSCSFLPAHDPVMDDYAANQDRPIDVLFVGTVSRHHVERTRILDRIAKLRKSYRIEYCLDTSRLVTLAETPLGWVRPLKDYRRSRDIRAVATEPVFGRDLYDKLSHAKIVLNGNGAIELVGSERGNMRCWEAMGCGAALLTDEGHYPEGMASKTTLEVYPLEAPEKAAVKAATMLADPQRTTHLARTGYDMIRTRYSKQQQWQDFLALL